jgi:hypothetical protein
MFERLREPYEHRGSRLIASLPAGLFSEVSWRVWLAVRSYRFYTFHA